MPTIINLPRETLHCRSTIDNCEWRIRHFVEHDAYLAYDYWITTRGLPDATVTLDHLRAINNAMRARASSKPWTAFFDRPLAELADIPPDLDLISDSEQEAGRGLSALLRLCQRIASARQVTDMAVSKVLHLIRPNFVPISDTYVRRCLGIPEREWMQVGDRGTFYASRLERVAHGIRVLGRENRVAVDSLMDFANSLPPVIPASGPFKGKQIPVLLTRIRVLDILLWTEVAIYGSTPHPVWLAAHQRAFGGPPEAAAREHPNTRRSQNAPRSQAQLPEVEGVVLFKDDDAGYLDWLKQYPYGLVLNCERLPRAAYLMLHRATCGTINGTPARGLSWTGPYVKACATSEAALEQWAELTTRGTLQPCGRCRP